ncbi:MAG: hypothetical protein JJU00_05300 [Opitutales bacterium]|nr:hypothetical protein [Opitutales bacterium]
MTHSTQESISCPVRRLYAAALALAGLLAAVPQICAEATLPYLVVHGRAFVEHAGGDPAPAQESGVLRAGSSIRTEAASAVVLFFESGARLSLMSEGRLRFDGEERRDTGVDHLVFFSNGSLVGRVPADRAGERLRVTSHTGEIRVREADFVTTSFGSRETVVTQLIGVESGNLSFVSQEEGDAAARTVYAGDSITVGAVMTGGRPEIQTSERLLSGDMRDRLQAGLTQIEEASVRRDFSVGRVRETRAPSTIPPPDRLRDLSPGAGLPAPRERN